jgi:hypothetical protein
VPLLVALFVFAAIVLFFSDSLIVLLIFAGISSAVESGVSRPLKSRPCKKGTRSKIFARRPKVALTQPEAGRSRRQNVPAARPRGQVGPGRGLVMPVGDEVN